MEITRKEAIQILSEAPIITIVLSDKNDNILALPIIPNDN